MALVNLEKGFRSQCDNLHRKISLSINIFETVSPALVFFNQVTFNYSVFIVCEATLNQVQNFNPYLNTSNLFGALFCTLETELSVITLQF